MSTADTVVPLAGKVRSLRSRDDLKDWAAQAVGVCPDEFDEKTSLIELGLDSINMMRLPVMLKSQGIEISVRDLIKNPTVEEWWALIEKASGALRSIETASPVLRPTSDRFPLTPVQQAYLIGRRNDHALGGVACHLYCEFDGDGVDPARLERSVRALSAHHPMLRCQFFEDGYQRILPESPWRKLHVYDFRGLDASESVAQLVDVRESLSHRLFDVFSGEVFDVRLSLLPEERTRVHFNIDLLVADVFSISILLRDLAKHYSDGALPDSGGLDFANYLRRQTVDRAKSIEEDAQYWRERLPDLPAGPALPLRTDPEQVTSGRITRRQLYLSNRDIDDLQSRARAEKVTLAASLAAAFALVLGRWSSEQRFLLNIPLFDREEIDPAVGNMIADFTNLVLAEMDTSNVMAFSDFALAVQKSLHDGIGHASYSGVDVLRDMSRFKGGSRGAPIVFACNLKEALLTPEFERQFGTLGWSISQTPQVWLDHQTYRLRDGLLLNWDAVEKLFPLGLLDAMFESYEHVVRWLCKNDWKERPPLPLPEPQSMVRARVNATAAPMAPKRLHEPFLEYAQLTPHAPAILSSSGMITYRSLEATAKAIAVALAEKGVKAGDHVAVVLPKSVDQIASVLGVSLAGAVYVPIAADGPSDRLSRILRDAGCTAGIVSPESTFVDRWPEEVIRVDPSEIGREAGLAGRFREPETRAPSDLAYIIYTSGSTGAPKGVMIEHQAAFNTIVDINRRFGVTSDDRIFGVSSLTFDLSVYDIFGAFAVGAALVLPDDAGRRDPSHWLPLMEDQSVTVWNTVPALMAMLIEFVELSRPLRFPKSMRLALLSGDWIPLTLPERIRALSPEMEIVGLGGATEASIWSNWFNITDVSPEWTSIPYGYPLTNQQYHVLDVQREPCPDWVEGDLFIGGAGLARGYWNDDEKTNASFIRSSSGERLYKTGDRARYWPNGTLEFLGRKDSQVKIGGHRVELGEIDAALGRVSGVGSAVSDIQTVNGQKRIVATVTIDRSAVRSGAVLHEQKASKSAAIRKRQVRHAGARAAEKMAGALDPAQFRVFWERVEALSVAAIARTLRRSGCLARFGDTRSFSDVCADLRVMPRFNKLVAQWLRLLAEQGVFEAVGPDRYRCVRVVSEEEYGARWRDLRQTTVFGESSGAILDYLQRSIDAHQDMLSGAIDPLEVYFAGGSTEAAEGIYRFNPFMQQLNGIAAAVLSTYVDVDSEERTQEIFEIGAGTGGTTASLLPALNPSRVRYLFTDLSDFFLDAANERFNSYNYIEFCRFDINRHPSVQGVEIASKDAIVAINVMHDARHVVESLKSLRLALRPGGMLLMIAATQNCALQMISIAFIEGLSDYADERLETNLPFLTESQWRKALGQAGFIDVDIFPNDGRSNSGLAQRVLIAYAPDRCITLDPKSLDIELSSMLPEYMIPRRYVVVDELPLSSNGKVDRARLPRFAENASLRRAASVPPETGLEADIAKLWSAVLNRTGVFADDNFFDLGGDSLLATRVVGELRGKFEIDLSIRRLFEHPTLREFGKHVATRLASKEHPQ